MIFEHSDIDSTTAKKALVPGICRTFMMGNVEGGGGGGRGGGERVGGRRGTDMPWFIGCISERYSRRGHVGAICTGVLTKYRLQLLPSRFRYVSSCVLT